MARFSAFRCSPTSRWVKIRVNQCRNLAPASCRWRPSLFCCECRDRIYGGRAACGEQAAGQADDQAHGEGEEHVLYRGSHRESRNVELQYVGEAKTGRYAENSAERGQQGRLAEK